ncbi:MAG: ABC-F family ATP-binding cassette domain-containing protein, partial [Bacteroidales bacterium]|nr:ABC-F family ATP-binding cassette domain-containing protein [Bacteroidales bacterium]
MISINNVSVSFGGFTLLNDINFHITDKDRIGLVGKNGAGKSTLLKLILGLNTPSEGNIMVPPGIKLGYLPQQMEHAKDKTVLQEALTAFDELIKFHKEVEFLNNEIVSRTDYESKEYNNLIVQLNNLNDKIAILEQEPIESQAEKVLLGLGFKRDQLSRQTSTFSQGWNMRIEL